MNSLGIIILAAGVGKRMKSKIPKVLHPICGRPMLSYVIDTAVSLNPEKVVIVSHPKVKEEMLKRVHHDRGSDKIEFVVQDPPRGTGDAVLCAESIFKDFDGPILILCGDVPLLTADTINKLIDSHKANGAVATVLTAIPPDPASYGRIVKSKINSKSSSGQKPKIKKIVEAVDAEESIKRIKEINTGIYVFDKSPLFYALHKIKPSNVQAEYYLTDTIEILATQDKEVYAYEAPNWQEVIGINTRKALSEVESILQAQIIEHHQLAGVTIKAPLSVIIDSDVQIGADTVIHAGAQLLGNTQIGEDCEIGTNTIIINSIISSGTKIGEGSNIKDAIL